MNNELKAAGIYTPIYHKQITAWLGLRNAAAHGKYTDYTEGQVKQMYSGVLGFMARVN